MQAGEKNKSSLNEVNLPGAVDKAYGEYLAFESFRLPDHSAGSIHLHDSDFGSTLNHSIVPLQGFPYNPKHSCSCITPVYIKFLVGNKKP